MEFDPNINKLNRYGNIVPCIIFYIIKDKNTIVKI